MGITKKFDRAFQWAGERMGHEAKTTMSDDFKTLETEMALRFDGMERLQKSMSAYVKWLGRRGEFEDREKGLPAAYLGRTMISHGEDFEPDSDFGSCLLNLGRATERSAAIQETLVADATTTWLESIERSLAMMKEFQASRKKLESRRLAYDASTTKMQKAKREDFRLEEELRSAKAKYEEASEDVFRRMQDIKDAEADSVRDLSQFLDAQLDYHERCAEELRQVRQNWPMADAPVRGAYGGGGADRHSIRSRSNTTTSYEKRLPRTQSAVVYEQDDEPEPEPVPARMPIRSISSRSVVDPPPRLSVARHNTIQAGASLERAGLSRPMAGDAGAYAVSPLNVSQLRGQLRPVSRLSPGNNDVFADRDDDTASVSGSGSPDWCERSASPATSFGSLSRSTSNAAVTNGVHSMGLGVRKVPPPPPSRAKKPPPPPVPAKRLQ